MSTSDHRRFVTGDGVYVDDLQLPGTLHVTFVRSPHAHARIRDIDPGRAPAIPGVVAVLTPEHLGALNASVPPRFQHPGLRRPPMPRPLAHGTVRYVGEPVAAVVADARYAAADAADLVNVEYEPLAAVSSLEAARAAGAAPVHAGLDDNVAGTFLWRVGDPNAAFAAAAVRLAFRLAINRGAAIPIETRGCVAAYDLEAGRLTVWASTQSPHYLRSAIATMVGLDETQVRVVASDVGGAFGVKGGAPREYLAVAALAVRLGRPVKWVETRREHFVACEHDRDQTHHLEVAATREGKLLGLRDLFWMDVGAYALYGHLIAIHTVNHMIGPYRLPHLEVQLESIYTHRVPTGAYRGAGRPQGTFVIERVMDHLARALDLDPVVVRRRNLLPAEAMPYDTGLRTPDGGAVRYDSGNYPHLLTVALDRFDYDGWRDAQRRRREAGGAPLGVGVAMYVEETAAHGYETVTLRLTADGEVHLAAGPPSGGQGLAPVLIRLVAGELGVSPAAVSISTGDTTAMPESFGTHGSRVATMIGNATALAARELAARIRALAARALDCAVDDVALKDGRAHHASRDGQAISLGDLVRRATGDGAGRSPEAQGLEVSAMFEPGGPAWSSGVHLVVLELDRETGKTRIIKYLIAHDSGAVLDEAAVQRQILGAAVQGIGGTLAEQIVYDEDGQPLTATLADFAMPRAADVPPIEFVRLETPSPLNPLGLKGAGESGCMPVYAALAAAVEDAIGDQGASVRALPLSPQGVWAMLHAATREGK